MAIILEDTFADETGITEVVPTGSIVNTANTEVITLDAPNITEAVGFYANTDVASLDEEDNLHFSFEFSAASGLTAIVGAGRGIDTLDDLHYMVATYPGGNPLVSLLWNTQFGSGFTAAANTRYYFLVMYGSERQAIYYNTSGFSNDLSSDWTLLSTIQEDVADVGESVLFFAYATTGTAGDTITVYPYQFRDNEDLIIDDAPAPTNPAATAVAWHTIRVTFTDNGTESTETSVKLERSLTGGGIGFSEVGSALDGVGTIDATGLSPSTQYFFRLRADFSFGAIHHYSDYTSEVNATTPALSGGGIDSSHLILMEDDT